MGALKARTVKMRLRTPMLPDSPALSVLVARGSSERGEGGEDFVAMKVSRLV
jgi:hypothetical protein